MSVGRGTPIWPVEIPRALAWGPRNQLELQRSCSTRITFVYVGENVKEKSIKLQKYLAECGLGSRRQLEQAIINKLVTVDGQIAHLGQRVHGQEVILFNGTLVSLPESETTQLILYHKPIDEVCTQHDPQERRTVFAALPKCPHGRWIMVGRLDKNTSGLLLFTNNGELANRLMHPRYQIERTYQVTVKQELQPKIYQQLLDGVPLSDGLAQCKNVKKLFSKQGNTCLELVLTQGRNREVRRIFQALNVELIKLHRIKYANFLLAKSHVIGAIKPATPAQLNFIKKKVGL